MQVYCLLTWEGSLQRQCSNLQNIQWNAFKYDQISTQFSIFGPLDLEFNFWIPHSKSQTPPLRKLCYRRENRAMPL